MYLRRLTLRGVRNFSSLDLRLPQGLILLKGGNAQGKTNLLEAIHYLSLFRSLRAKEDADLIKWGEKRAHIRGELLRQGRLYILEVFISQEGKMVKVDYKTTNVSTAMGKVLSILYRDEDVDIIRGEPSLRRDFLDDALSQIYPRYRVALSSFKKALSQRNALLRTDTSPEELSPWDEEFSRWASVLVQMRKKYVQDIYPFFRQVHSQLTEGKEEVSLKYLATTGEGAEEIFEDLRRMREEEISKGMSLIGPQRDDLDIRLNSAPARYFASLGQGRTLALSLRFAQFLFYRELMGESPIFLMDDLSSDIEENRREKIGSLLASADQAFVATTQRELLPSSPTLEITLEGGGISNLKGGMAK